VYYNCGEPTLTNAPFGWVIRNFFLIATNHQGEHNYNGPSTPRSMVNNVKNPNTYLLFVLAKRVFTLTPKLLIKLVHVAHALNKYTLLISFFKNVILICSLFSPYSSFFSYFSIISFYSPFLLRFQFILSLRRKLTFFILIYN